MVQQATAAAGHVAEHINRPQPSLKLSQPNALYRMAPLGIQLQQLSPPQPQPQQEHIYSSDGARQHGVQRRSQVSHVPGQSTKQRADATEPQGNRSVAAPQYGGVVHDMEEM